MENKKASLNPINKKDNKCFQCAVIVALNHEKMTKYPQRITRKIARKDKTIHQEKMMGNKIRKIM